MFVINCILLSAFVSNVLIKVPAIRDVLLRVDDDVCEGRNQISSKYFRILRVLTLNCVVRLSYNLCLGS